MRLIICLRVAHTQALPFMKMEEQVRIRLPSLWILLWDHRDNSPTLYEKHANVATDLSFASILKQNRLLISGRFHLIFSALVAGE